jgi:hypothetical protein
MVLRTKVEMRKHGETIVGVHAQSLGGRHLGSSRPAGLILNTHHHNRTASDSYPRRQRSSTTTAIPTTQYRYLPASPVKHRHNGRGRRSSVIRQVRPAINQDPMMDIDYECTECLNAAILTLSFAGASTSRTNAVRPPPCLLETPQQEH